MPFDIGDTITFDLTYKLVRGVKKRRATGNIINKKLDETDSAFNLYRVELSETDKEITGRDCIQIFEFHLVEALALAETNNN